MKKSSLLKFSDQDALGGWLSTQCLCYSDLSDLDSAYWFLTCFNFALIELLTF